MPDYIAELDSWCPDDEVIEQLQKIIKTELSYQIPFDEGPIQIPEDCKYEVISKALIKYDHGIRFGPCFRIVIAVGGLVKPIVVCPEAKFCFATFWYTSEKLLITTKFSTVSPD